MAFHFFDAAFPESEQLPRVIQYSFVPCDTSMGGFAQVKLVDRFGNQLGEFLTDCARTDTGYRFHDVIHSALAVFLGWSPVTRGLFQCKRKSDPVIDEVEDGGLAIVIEEAVVRLCYEDAKRYHFYEGVASLNPELLQTIKHLVASLEVRCRTNQEWSAVVIRGFEVWRQVRSHHGGTIRGDLCKRTLEFISPP